MSRNFTRALTLFLVAVVALGAMTGGAAALETTDATDINVGPSDIQDDGSSSVDGFNANAGNYSLIEFKTPIANTTDGFSISISAENNTHATYDDLDDEYTLTEAVDTTDDATDDSDLHTFNISHSDLETVPVEANGETTVTIDVTYEYTDGTDTSGTVEDSFTATLNATGERTVLYITDDNLGDDSMGGATTSETVEYSFIESLTQDDEEYTTYDLDDELAVDGSNTTITVFMTGEMADGFENTLEDDAEDGDLVLGQTLLADETLTMTFNNEVDSDLANGTYGVYDSSADTLTVEVGDEHADASTLGVRAVNDKPTNVGDFDRDAYANAFGEADLGLRAMISAFGFGGALSTWTAGFGFLSMIPLITLGGRRAVAE
jgi:hypothetical protein